MLVKATITQKKEITKEIKLPFHSKMEDVFYRINEDQSVLRICLMPNQIGILLSKRSEWFEASYFKDAVDAKECTANDVVKATALALQLMDKQITQLQTA